MVCPLCHRAPDQAAQFAILHHVTCVTCTPRVPVGAKHASPALVQADSPDSTRLQHQLADAHRQIEMLRAAVASEDARILVLDFDQGCLRWLTGCQERSEPIPAEINEFVEIQRQAVRDGFFIARRHSADVRETLEPLG